MEEDADISLENQQQNSSKSYFDGMISDYFDYYYCV